MRNLQIVGNLWPLVAMRGWASKPGIFKFGGLKVVENFLLSSQCNSLFCEVGFVFHPGGRLGAVFFDF